MQQNRAQNQEQRRQFEHWSKIEAQRFLCYLGIHYDSFEIIEGKKKINRGTFTKMAEFIETRNPQQCRTHFTRIIKEKSNIRTAHEFIRKKLFKFGSQMNQAVQKFIKFLEAVLNETNKTKETVSVGKLSLQLKNLWTEKQKYFEKEEIEEESFSESPNQLEFTLEKQPQSKKIPKIIYSNDCRKQDSLEDDENQKQVDTWASCLEL